MKNYFKLMTFVLVLFSFFCFNNGFATAYMLNQTGYPLTVTYAEGVYDAKMRQCNVYGNKKTMDVGTANVSVPFEFDIQRDQNCALVMQISSVDKTVNYLPGDFCVANSYGSYDYHVVFSVIPDTIGYKTYACSVLAG